MEKILELNLIKSRMKTIETRRRFSRYSRIVYLCAACVFAAITVKFVIVSGEVSKLKSKISAAEASLAAQRGSYGLEKHEAEWRGYRAGLESIISADNARSTWNMRLAQLANLLPPNMCILNIQTNSDQGKTNCLVEIMSVPKDEKGFTDSEKYISALENDSHIGKGIKLEAHERKQVDKKDVVVFKILLSAVQQ